MFRRGAPSVDLRPLVLIHVTRLIGIGFLILYSVLVTSLMNGQSMSSGTVTLNNGVRSLRVRLAAGSREWRIVPAGSWVTHVRVRPSPLRFTA